MATKLEGAAQSAVPRLTNWGWRMYNQPGSFGAAPYATAGNSAFGASGAAEAGTLASEGAGTAGMTMAEAGGAAGGSSLGGMGASGMTAGGAASLVAPLVMAYLRYQAGSGENTPIRKQYETRGAGKMLADKMAGKEMDPKNAYRDYGLYPKSAPAWLDPNSAMNAGEGYSMGNETIDPRGYSSEELYALMHGYGTGAKQQGGLGNSGYSDQQIDQMFGDQQGDLSKALGGAPPDWSKTTWDQSGWTPQNTLNRQKELADKVGAMSETDRGDVINRNRRWLQEGDPGTLDDKFVLESLEREREQAELEKMLGYRLGQQTQA